MERDGQPVSEPITARISAQVGAQVETERRRQSMTRDELAAAAQDAGAPPGFTGAALRNVEIARRGVLVDELVWLAGALHCTPRDLLGEYAELFGPDKPAAPIGGEVEAATRAALDELGELDGIEAPLAAIALADARALDDDAGMATAAVSRELRATLAQLWEGRDGDDEEDEEDYSPV